MNKYQEAISNYFTAKLNFDNEMYKAMDLLEELADKSTPMKTIFSKELGVTTCGSCKKYLVSSNNWIPKYCSECGQALDWSDEK